MSSFDNENDFSDDDTRREEIIEDGEDVFSHHYCSDHFGGGGFVVIYRLHDEFAFSSDIGSGGPYDSFEEALKHSCGLEVTEMSSSIRCSLLSSRQLAKKLRISAESPSREYPLMLNGELRIHIGGKLKKRQK